MIIVFGSNVLDLFFHQADLPPHDTALFLDSHEEAPGGKGANQAVAAAKAGSEVRFYGALGDGGHGRQMYKNLASYGIDVSGIQMVETPSGLATIFVNEEDGTHRIVVSQGANLLAKQDKIPDKHLNSNTIVLVQGELPIGETEALIVRAKKNGATTVMNFAPATAKISEALLNNLDYMIVNEHEAELLGKAMNEATEDKIALAQNLRSRFNMNMLITLGAKGALACDEGGLHEISPLKIKAVDTVGAGDAFTGYFCSALDQGKSLEEAYRSASVAGSLACTRVGAQTALPKKNEVETFLPQISVSRLALGNAA
ncbi:MAG: ribokinase [Pseudobdellovibrionaceae bacterium]